MDTTWQEFGLKANPFDEVALAEGGAIDIQQAFVGRDRERSVLTKITESQTHSCVAICGDVGVGKTSLANIHKHYWKYSHDNRPLFSFRGEIEARRDLLNIKNFILEIIATILREIEFLDPNLISQNKILKKVERIADITQDFSWSAGLVAIEAGVGESTVRPAELPVAKLEEYLDLLLDFVRSNPIDGKQYKGIIVHVNNFDVVLDAPEDKKQVVTFFDEIRDLIQRENIHFVFLGPTDFYDEVISSRQRVRSVFNVAPLVLGSLSKRELARALTKRMRLLQSDDVSEYVKPFSDEAVFQLHDLYKGDVRSVLGALRDVAKGLVGGVSNTLQSDEALLLLARERNQRLQASLTRVQLEVLQYLVDTDLSLSQAEVSRLSGKAASNISKYFKELRQRGIIEEEPDRRGKEKKFNLTKEYVPLKFLKASEDRVRDRRAKEVEQLKLFDL